MKLFSSKVSGKLYPVIAVNFSSSTTPGFGTIQLTLNPQMRDAEEQISGKLRIGLMDLQRQVLAANPEMSLAKSDRAKLAPYLYEVKSEGNEIKISGGNGNEGGLANAVNTLLQNDLCTSACLPQQLTKLEPLTPRFLS